MYLTGAEKQGRASVWFSLGRSFKLKDHFMCMNGLLACTYVCYMCSLCLRRLEESITAVGTGATDACDLPCGCSELDPGPKQEQLVFLNN